MGKFIIAPSLTAIYQELLLRLAQARKKQHLVTKALFVKLRFNDFETTTIQMPGVAPDANAYTRLLTQAWQRGKRPVRLIGIGLQFHPPDMPQQLQLF